MNHQDQFARRRGDYEALVRSFRRQEKDEFTIDVLDRSLNRLKKIEDALKDREKVRDVDWMLALKALEECIESLIETMCWNKKKGRDQLLYELFKV